MTIRDVMNGCSWQAEKVFFASLFYEFFRSFFKFCMLDCYTILPIIREFFMSAWRKLKFTAMTCCLPSAVRIWELNGDALFWLAMKF